MEDLCCDLANCIVEFLDFKYALLFSLTNQHYNDNIHLDKITGKYGRTVTLNILSSGKFANIVYLDLSYNNNIEKLNVDQFGKLRIIYAMITKIKIVGNTENIFIQDKHVVTRYCKFVHPFTRPNIICQYFGVMSELLKTVSINNLLLSKIQINTYEILSASIEQFSIELKYIWSARYRIDSSDYYSFNLTYFIMKSENDEFVWDKHEALRRDGGQNHVYIFGNKIKTSEWIKIDDGKRQEYWAMYKNTPIKNKKYEKIPPLDILYYGE